MSTDNNTHQPLNTDVLNEDNFSFSAFFEDINLSDFYDIQDAGIESSNVIPDSNSVKAQPETKAVIEPPKAIAKRESLIEMCRRVGLVRDTPPVKLDFNAQFPKGDDIQSTGVTTEQVDDDDDEVEEQGSNLSTTLWEKIAVPIVDPVFLRTNARQYTDIAEDHGPFVDAMFGYYPKLHQYTLLTERDEAVILPLLDSELDWNTFRDVSYQRTPHMRADPIPAWILIIQKLDLLEQACSVTAGSVLSRLIESLPERIPGIKVVQDFHRHAVVEPTKHEMASVISITELIRLQAAEKELEKRKQRAKTQSKATKEVHELKLQLADAGRLQRETEKDMESLKDEIARKDLTVHYEIQLRQRKTQEAEELRREVEIMRQYLSIKELDDVKLRMKATEFTIPNPIIRHDPAIKKPAPLALALPIKKKTTTPVKKRTIKRN